MGWGLEIGTAFLQGRESHAAPTPHFHLQPVPACVGEGSIYSALFLAPSSEEPDSQLMTGTLRVVSAALCTAHARSRCACGGSRLLPLQMPFLPWEVGCARGLSPHPPPNPPSPAFWNPRKAGRGHLFHFCCSQ